MRFLLLETPQLLFLKLVAVKLLMPSHRTCMMSVNQISAFQELRLNSLSPAWPLLHALTRLLAMSPSLFVIILLYWLIIDLI